VEEERQTHQLREDNWGKLSKVSLKFHTKYAPTQFLHVCMRKGLRIFFRELRKTGRHPGCMYIYILSLVSPQLLI